ncbi:MAG TPA: HAD family phosphatase [Streptosporangiaceae bacterium]
MSVIDGQFEAARLRAVLFDMDGLLVNTEPIWFEVEHAVMARLGGEWTPADQQALVGGSLQRSVGYLLNRAGAGSSASHEEVAGWLLGGMAALLAEREAALMPGALDLLCEVEQAGIPRVLVTSSEQVIMDAVLTSLAIRGVAFTATVCGADVSEPKPDPEPYRLAATLIGADPRHCAALEDSPNGVGSALAAGCVTIAVPGVAPVEPRDGLTIVDSLTDVDLSLLRNLAARGTVTPAPPR